MTFNSNIFIQNNERFTKQMKNAFGVLPSNLSEFFYFSKCLQQ